MSSIALPLSAQEGDEAALVQAAQHDPAAFAALYDRYVDRIYAFAWAHTSHPEEAADLTQQVFVRALDALPRYRASRVPFAAWLFRIARNAAVDWHRRQRVTVPWETLPEAAHPRSADSAERAVLLRALLSPLSTETQEALILRFAVQLTLAEIGVVLGKSEDAVRKQISRGLHTLKEQYHDETN